MANEIEIEIVARLDSVDKSIKSLEDKAEKAGKKIGKDLGEGLADSVSASFTNMAATAVAVLGTIAAAFSVNKIIHAASEQEAAITRLNQSLANAGTFSEAASKRIQEFANVMEEATGIQEETILGAAALARNFAHTNEEAVKLTEAAINLSAATGQSLDTAVQNLGKTLTGNAGKLAMNVQGVKSLTEEQLKAGAAIDLVNERFQGAGAAQANTFAGSINKVSNSFDALLKTLGRLITDSPVVRELLKFIADQVTNVTKALNSMTSGKDIIGDLIISVVDFGIAINKYMSVPLEAVWNIAKSLFYALKTGFFEVQAIFLEAALGFVQTASIFTDKFLGIEAQLEVLSQSANAKILANSTMLNESMAAVFASNTLEASGNQWLSTLRAKLASAAKITRDFTNGTEKEISSSMTKIFDFGASFARGLSSIFQVLGESIVNSSNGWGKFGGAVLGYLGTLAIEVGTFIITTSLAFEALKATLKGLPGGVAIAAGAGLIILGGALKALSAKLGGATAGVATPIPAISAPSIAGDSGGGGVSAGISSPIGESAASAPETQEVRPGTAVNVVIQGNVLGDKRTLGKEIADALNEAFGSDGIVIAQGAIV